jgi:hypothetical protein
MMNETPCVSGSSPGRQNKGKNMKEKQTTKPQTKLPVDREAVRVLAIELGVREAARRCGLSEDRVRKWSSRYKWLEQKAPKQQEAAVTVVTTPGDVLLATHKELGERSRTAILQAGTAAAEQARDRAVPLPVNDVQQFAQLTGALARVLGWGNDSRPSVNYYGDVNTVVVCDEARRRELIEQRQRLLEQEARQASGHKIEAAAPVTIPAPETQSNASVGAVDGIATHDQSPVVQKDPLILKMESIARAETWRSEPENNAAMFGPHSEEIY